MTHHIGYMTDEEDVRHRQKRMYDTDRRGCRTLTEEDVGHWHHKTGKGRIRVGRMSM